MRLCGVGLEELGLEEFQEKKFFTGELFLDTKQQIYKDLGFKRYSALTVLGGLTAKVTRLNISKANSKNIKGNLKGDGMLNGGMLIVTAGGEKVLLSHKQTSPGDHVPNEKILEVLGIEVEEGSKEESGSAPEGMAAEGGSEK